MRYAALLMLLLLTVSTIALAQNATSQGDRMNTQQQQTIQGCLAGSTDSYRLTTPTGTIHMLMGDNQELSAHVGQYVQLSGKRDVNRDASASSDEGTPHGLRFFRVQSVSELQGSCSRKTAQE